MTDFTLTMDQAFIGMDAATKEEGGFEALYGAVFLQASYQLAMHDLGRRDTPKGREIFYTATSAWMLKKLGIRMRFFETGETVH